MKSANTETVFNLKKSQHYVKNALEKDYINGALQRNKGNVLKSALELGLARPTLHKKMKIHGIKSSDYKK